MYCKPTVTVRDFNSVGGGEGSRDTLGLRDFFLTFPECTPMFTRTCLSGMCPLSPSNFNQLICLLKTCFFEYCWWFQMRTGLLIQLILSTKNQKSNLLQKDICCSGVKLAIWSSLKGTFSLRESCLTFARPNFQVIGRFSHHNRGKKCKIMSLFAPIFPTLFPTIAEMKVLTLWEIGLVYSMQSCQIILDTWYLSVQARFQLKH